MTETAYIPNELKQLAMWGCYDKDKRLISALSGFPTISQDLRTLTDYRTALEFANSSDRVVGLALVIPAGYVVVDIDMKVSNGEIINEWLSELDTYKENNLNKNGLHIILKADFKQNTKTIALDYGLKILKPKDYVCLTGDILDESLDEISYLQSAFDRLYNKYFNNISKTSENRRYYFAKSSENKRQYSEDEIKSFISSSIASSLFFQLMDGNYLLCGFNNKDEAIICVMRILIFWSGADQQLVYRIIKKSKLFDKSLLENQGKGTYLDLLYENALEEQKCFYDKDTYIADNYTFDQITGITKFFKDYSLDDTGNAQRIYDKYHEILRYNTYDKVFMIYNADLGIWVADTSENLKIKELTDTIITDLRNELNTTKVKANPTLANRYLTNIARFSSSKGKDCAINELKHLKEIPIDPNQLDADKLLLNTLSGVINLKNGMLLEHSPDFMMTKSTHCYVDMKHEPTAFIEFMKETTCGNKEIFNYLKKLIGYCLTGLNTDQSYYAWKGNGNNGKSVLLNIMTRMLGDYAANVQVETFCEATFQRDGSSANPDIARLKGVRFVRCNEPKRGMALNESLMKQITGGDPITCRKLRKDPFEFRPQCKIIIGCNNMLKINGTTRGDWRRVKIVEFPNDVPEDQIDVELEDKLAKEIPSILGYYALQGCLEFQDKGLKAPEKIKKSVEDYRVVSNTVINFMKTRTEEVNGAVVSNADLFRAYMKWCKEMNEREPLTNALFNDEVNKCLSPLVVKRRSKGGRVAYFNLELLKQSEGNEKTEGAYHIEYTEDLP